MPTKFLLLYRGPIESAPSTSPEDMQKAFERWSAWRAKFDKEIAELGDGLKLGGAVYKNGTVTDGPYVESKEIMGGFSVLQTDSLSRAIEIAKECPHAAVPGASVEIREFARY